MRRVLWAVLLAVAAIAGSAPSGTTAAASEPIDSYCSPTGDYCLAITIRRQRVKFEISTPSFNGPYEICVKDPGGRRCHGFTLEREGDLYSDRVDWARRFDGEPGRYKVVWKRSGVKLGEALRFVVEGPASPD